MTESMLAGVYGRQSRNKAKSIAEQLTAGASVAAENGWHMAGTYQDGSSASRFARGQRDDWQRVMDDITAGVITVLILWEASRGDRTLTSWSQLLDLCRDKGVCIYVIADERLYDPRKARDWKTLATAGVDSAGESDIISVRVRRGHAGAAAAGRPSHGRTPYGYVRRYDTATGELVGQEPDPVTAPVVRELFARLAKGEAISALVKDFNARDLPRAAGADRWYRVRVRDLALNRAYIGERVYNGAITPGMWPALVEPEVFHAVQRILMDPQRAVTRAGRVVHLLSAIGRPTPCGGRLEAVRGRYRCLDDGCVTIVQAETDRLVERMVLGRLSRPDVFEQLRQANTDTDRAAAEAEAKVAELEGQLKEWRLSAARRETSAASLAVIEADLEGQIRAVQRRLKVAHIPPELREILEPGVDVRVRWDDTPMPAKRRVVAFLVDLRVDKADRPGVRTFDEDRLGGSRWKGDPLTWREHWAAADVA